MKKYIISERTRDELLTLLRVLLEKAAADANDKKANMDDRKLARKICMTLLDLQGDLLYADGGEELEE
jgi:hypothetical protein